MERVNSRLERVNNSLERVNSKPERVRNFHDAFILQGSRSFQSTDNFHILVLRNGKGVRLIYIFLFDFIVT